MRSGLKKFMTTEQFYQLFELPTTHQNCVAKCGVARPGKTARDKAKGGYSERPNRRLWDFTECKWLKA